MDKQITVVLVGAGDRGSTYTDIMREMPERYKVVAVAEPIPSRREYVRARHNIPEDRCFADWWDLFALGKIADLALICTLDAYHFQPAMAAISLHYDLLLEKPVSPDPVSCETVAQAAEQAGVKVVVCHVLRYTPLFTAVKRLIDEGRLGEIISVNHEENVGNRHQSHSFVRGNWGNTGRSSNMLLQKSCHDLDILQWLIGRPCRRIQSFGSLRYFTRANAPADAPERCLDGCPHGETCPYNAVKLYLDDKENAWFREACTRIPSPSDADVERALRTTQYGKCVFRCDNDAVDHQTVNMLFDGGVTAAFTMCAFNRGGRWIHIMGTKGELHASLTADEEPIRLYDFETKTTSEIPVTGRDGLPSGHGGGDRGIIESLYGYLTGQSVSPSISGIRVSVDSHLLAFAAEESRRTGAVVDVDAYRASLLCEGPQTAYKAEAVRHFCPDSTLLSLSRLGSGHIHDTYLADVQGADGTERKLVLQRINQNVFREPEKLMENIVRVTAYLRQRIAETGGDPARETLRFLTDGEGKPYYLDPVGEYWRCSDYIEGADSYDTLADPELFRQGGLAFGRFHRLMADFPSESLYIPIRGFHDTAGRLEAFKKAAAEDRIGRAAAVREEIQFFLSNQNYATAFSALLQDKKMLRVTHNDTKLNNVLFDRATRRGLCVIDLDTVGPGLAMHDFGDAVRSGCNPAGESPADLGLVRFDLALFVSFAQGYLSGAAGALSEAEIRLFPMGALVMTYECGLRFLTDYLQGDVYFRITSPDHNLLRARAQIALFRDMQGKWAPMNAIISRILADLKDFRQDTLPS